jgi:hypothetical protein
MRDAGLAPLAAENVARAFGWFVAIKPDERA